MNIILDKEAGFCFGVKRSVELALSDKNIGKRVQILGELIHNRDFINGLTKLGIQTIEKPDQLSGEIIIIRAHGCEKNTEKDIRKKFQKVTDATCPFVKNIQLLVERFAAAGYKIIIFGEENHPEVIGILSYAPEAYVVSGVNDLPLILGSEKVLLVSQTTQNVISFNEIADKLRSQTKNLEVKNTICDATSKKQKSAGVLADKVDLLIVVGGKNSCNTKNLAKIGEKYTKTIHIENETELDSEWFTGIENLGITAGASTPNEIIDTVIDKIKSFRLVRV